MDEALNNPDSRPESEREQASAPKELAGTHKQFSADPSSGAGDPGLHEGDPGLTDLGASDADDASPRFGEARQSAGSLPLDLIPLGLHRGSPGVPAGAPGEFELESVEASEESPLDEDAPGETGSATSRATRASERADAIDAESELLLHAGHAGWEPNVSAREVAVELKRVETEIRELLERGDIKRKRRYDGTRRWMELLEDVVSMRYTGPADEATLLRVRTLVARRQDLFRRLNFIVGTRHRWNT